MCKIHIDIYTQLNRNTCIYIISLLWQKLSSSKNWATSPICLVSFKDKNLLCASSVQVDLICTLHVHVLYCTVLYCTGTGQKFKHSDVFRPKFNLYAVSVLCRCGLMNSTLPPDIEWDHAPKKFQVPHVYFLFKKNQDKKTVI